MAELGHPIIGPQSYWKLTPAEVRVYAEGLQSKADREKAAREGDDAPSYNSQSKRRRDKQALQDVHNKVKGYD